jgi:hypothetical protein
MATPILPDDFKEFLKLFNEKRVEYLLIGGYAVGYYGYVRSTADINVWVAPNLENAERCLSAIREFGFVAADLNAELLLKPTNITRMGTPPFRIEVLTSISGVSFEECYSERVIDDLDGVEVSLISLEHLKLNKKASGRLKDLTDLEHLP